MLGRTWSLHLFLWILPSSLNLIPYIARPYYNGKTPEFIITTAPAFPQDDVSSYLLELRNEIWYHQCSEGSSYHHDISGGKLRASHSRLVDLALMYICKVIVSEIESIPSRLNTIVFKTVHDTLTAEQFDVLRRENWDYKTDGSRLPHYPINYRSSRLQLL